MNISRTNFNAQNLAFTGHKKVQDKKGYEQHSFYYLYDPYKYNCEVELYNIEKDKNCNISIREDEEPAKVLPMTDSRITVDISEIPQINSQEGFAYRFKLTDKKTGEQSYAFDNGSVTNILKPQNRDDKYNIVFNNRAIINKNGPMQLIMPDSYFPGIINTSDGLKLDKTQRESIVKNTRTHANKFGGNFYGIIKRLPELEQENVTRIVGTPFTKDTISSHKYWTENAYQISPDFGTEEDFKELQKELFKHNINWIADAALVNEGFEGIHFSHLLRKGNSSYAKNMFRADDKISLGILPDKCDFTRMKVINAPFSLSENYVYDGKNSDYDPSKPTYIQFYDDRLASEEQKKSESVFTTYEEKNTDNIFDITKHDDAVYPFALEVSPEELKRNFKRIAADHDKKVDLSNMEIIKQAADFANFNVVNKSAAGGLEVWDGNVDIAKLNFFRDFKDDARFDKLPDYERQEAIEDFDRATLAVRDYAINTGKYWTKLTDDTQFEYISSSLGGVSDSADEYMKQINKLAENHDFPAYVLETVDKEVIENVLTDNYHLRRLDDADMRADINPEGYGNDYTTSDYILRQAMDLPLETLPVAANLTGILSSPYIEKKANTDEELGVSRYDLTKAGNPNLPKKYKKVYSQVDDFYKNKVTPKILEILQEIPDISDEDGNVTEYGKYVISQAAPELTKYILLKSIEPNANISVKENGHIDFSQVNSDDITMQSLGIPYSGKTTEEEAQSVVDILNKGISKLNGNKLDDLKTKMKSRFANQTLNDFKVAEMIMDRTEAGLGWRIDAAKDIFPIDSIRSDSQDRDIALDNIIEFWTLFKQSVVDINPHAYTAAEITDFDQLVPKDEKAKYKAAADAEKKFLQETGITTLANYNFLFSSLPDLFCITEAFSPLDNNGCWMGTKSKNFSLREKLDKGWDNNPGYLFQGPEDSIINSYTFNDNQDKPRILHSLALDMHLFNSDFKTKEDREAAAEALGKNEDEIDFDKVSGKAIAMASRINEAVDNIEDMDKETKSGIKEAVQQIASGEFKGKKIDADDFGTRPFDVAIRCVMDQAEENKKTIPDREKIEAQILKNILEPAFSRYYSIYKLLITMPGSPTEFAGDKIGATGYETKAKNYMQQNRNVIHWEWLEGNGQKDDNYKFIKDFYDNMNKISNLRNREELSALNDGTTVTLPVATGEPENGQVKANEQLQAFLRYNDKGSVVITLHDSSGSNTYWKDDMVKKKDEVIHPEKYETSKTAPAETETETETEKKEKAKKEKKAMIIKTSTENEGLYNKIFLDFDGNNAKQGLKHGLAPGSEFKNANETDKATYKIAVIKDPKKDKEYYYLKKYDENGDEAAIQIQPEDYNTMILYKI